ncbi:ATP-binding cassette domain-containing protein [uncultured Microbacterium sp.]|uniref:ABC transporter ATP-binding protein n=1 Tax=uncultured Microbacterium sp. TaxID=191216 RepID=UPI0026267B29|nr:ATP-binding cassette domain-containing protein [uncultured Microbacterium sp.]
MPEGQVLEFDRVTKRFNAVTAVSDLSVRVEPGAVTGFLGPNGAGKTTSLRMLLGQVRPTSGTATIGGSAYSELRNPLRTVGAVLEEAAYRPRRTAARQLTIAAKANGIPLSRVDEVLRLVGLQDDAETRLGSYSLGMRQRLAVGSALLGDPGVLVLDEPANGLDPEGIRWMRLLMRRLADEGRTVLVSSHVLSEIEQVADNVVVLSKGHAVFSGPIETLEDPKGAAVVVDADNRAHLITALSAAKLNFDVLRSGVTVRNSDAKTVGAIAAAAGVPLTLLQQRGPSLEDVFLDLVYGRAGGPQLDEAANPVVHAPQSAGADTGTGDATALAGAAAAGAAVAGAASAVAEGVVAAAENANATDAEGAGASSNEESADETQSAEESDPDDAVSDGDTAQDDDGDAASGADIVADSGDTEHEDDDTAADADAADAPESVDPEAESGATESDVDVDPAAEPDATGDPATSDLDDAVSAPWAPSPTLTGEGEHSEPAPGIDADHDEPVDVILPQAVRSVSNPQVVDSFTFTELITGIPAAASSDDAEPAAPATEAIPVFTPPLADEDDDESVVDDVVDDAEDPRLAAMRTSLSSAASRFFDGPAPDYPYGDAPAQPAAEEAPAEGEPQAEGDQHQG